MRIYVAGASRELTLCSSYMSRLRAEGLDVVSDWPEMIAKEDGRLDADLTDAEATHYAWRDLEQVEASDILWVIIPESATKGMWVELGFGLALCRYRPFMPPKPSIIVSGNYAPSIFARCAGEKYALHGEAFARCVDLHRRMGRVSR